MRQAARRRQHHLASDAGGGVNRRGDGADHLAPNLDIDQPAGKDDDHALGAVRAGDRERRHIAGAHAGQLFERPFDVLGPDIAPVADNQILDSSGDDQGAVDHVAHVAGIEPAVLRDRL